MKTIKNTRETSSYQEFLDYEKVIAAIMKKRSEATQTLRTGCSKEDPQNTNTQTDRKKISLRY